MIDITTLSTRISSKTAFRIAGTNPVGIVHQEVWTGHTSGTDTVQMINHFGQRFGIVKVRVQYTTDDTGAPQTRFTIIR